METFHSYAESFLYLLKERRLKEHLDGKYWDNMQLKGNNPEYRYKITKKEAIQEFLGFTEPTVVIELSRKINLPVPVTIENKVKVCDPRYKQDVADLVEIMFHRTNVRFVVD